VRRGTHPSPCPPELAVPAEISEDWIGQWLKKGLRPIKTASYVYQNADGQDVVRKVRYALMNVEDGSASGSKTFIVQHRSLQSVLLGADRWESGIGQEGWASDLLYNRVGVSAAIASGDRIVLCEGEKDADSVRNAWGMCSTSWYQGAAGMTEEQCRVLLGAVKIYFMVDRDLVGYQLAFRHYQMLVRLGFSGSISMGLPAIESEKADISDHIASGLGPGSVRLLSPDMLANKIKKHGTLKTCSGRWGYGYGDNDDLGEWVVTRVEHG
jgi:hypothetical protein